MEETYDKVARLSRWYEVVELSKRTTSTLGTYITVRFVNDVNVAPFNARLSKQQLNTLRCSSTALRTQKTLDASRDKAFRLLCCEQTVSIVPHQLEQDTAPITVSQTRLSCYRLILDIITKAMEKTYGI